MSYTLMSELAEPPDLATVVRHLGPDVRVVEGIPEVGWVEPEAAPVHIHQVGKSTRGLEITIEGAEISVRMLSCASPDDWRLAYALLSAMCGPDATIVGEEGTTGRCATAWDDFSDVMTRELATGIVTIQTMIAQGHRMEMTGPVRTVYLGPQMLERVGANPLHLLQAIQLVQYVDAQGFEVVEYRDLGDLLGLPVAVGGFSVWDPTKSQAFAAGAPEVAGTRLNDFNVWDPTSRATPAQAPALGVQCDEGGLYIATQSIGAVAGQRVMWLDEQQFAVAASPAAELPAIVARAKEHRVDPHAGIRAMARGSDRKWWQFWKR